ncbi:hypothetical protein [Haloplanus rubicundus]|uniref:Uncharacterized protein n=1 Tax=Haloplanus rubicundus TaxID=1547898 RepID=A0A345EC03_9EURY|nr:hypothetical protein [Haloplanus rubicundus]AXG09725.1 hypothetical protein DU484_07545 [Haloplanus rubicundus]
MGLFDRLTFEDGLDVEFPDIDADPFEVTWQTKSIARHEPMMENYKVTANGRLFKEVAEYEHVPEEERPGYNEEIGGFENGIERARESRKKIHQGWSDTEYHGIFEFHRTIDGDYVSLDAKFTDGQLVEITCSD